MGLGASLWELTELDFEQLDRAIASSRRAPELHGAILAMSGHAHGLCDALRRGSVSAMGLRLRRMLYGAGMVAQLLGVSMEEVARRNLRKLMRRNPEVNWRGMA